MRRILLFLFSLAIGQAQSTFPGPTVVQSPPPLVAITTAQASLPVDQVGQHMHTIKVEFPTAAGTVTGIQVRVEATYRCVPDLTCSGSIWVPISQDILEAPLLGGQVYAFAKAYGVFPVIRVNSLLNVPGTPAPPMTVQYIGHVIPVVPFLTRLSDRWVF